MTCKDLILKKQNTTPLYTQPIIDPPKEYEKFIYKKIITENENVKLDKIRGMLSRKPHEDTWFNALMKLERRHYLDVLKCDGCNKETYEYCYDIKYYTDLDYRKKYDASGWRIVFINDIGYIQEAYHRTTIAKFLSSLNIIPDEITIPYVEYNQIDYKNIKKFNKLQQKINLIKKSVNGDIKIEIDIKQDKINETFTENEKIEEYSIAFTLHLALEQYAYNPYIKTYDSIELLRKDIFKYLRQNKKPNSQKPLSWFISIINLFKKL